MSFDHPTNAGEVCVRHEGGEWRVIVRPIRGKEEIRSFDDETFAQNFAEGQRFRLDRDEKGRCELKR